MAARWLSQKLVQNLLLAAASLAVAVVGFELFLRVIDYTYSPMSIKIEGVRHDWRNFHAFTDEHFVYDPVLLWRPRKGHSVFNAQGFRGPVLAAQKKPGEYRIFAIGDSNTLGWAGDSPDEGANWPTYLGEMLTAYRPGIKMINAGAWGYSSYQGLKRFEQVLAYEPDLVLISFGANDAHPVTVSDAEYAPPPSFKSPFFRLRIGQLAIGFWTLLTAGGEPDQNRELVPRVSLENYRAHLNRIIDMSKERTLGCILMTRPFIGESKNPRHWKTYGPAYVTATREVAAERNVPLIDFYKRFETAVPLFADESHFTEEGHHKAALYAYQRMKPLLRHLPRTLPEENK